MNDIERIWRGKTDAQVRAAAAALSDYQPGAQSVILAEFERRGLAVGPTADEETEEDYIRSLNLASVRSRFLARLVDGLAGLLPLFVVIVSYDRPELVMTGEMAVAVFWWWGYHLLSDAIPGGSVGKRFLRIDVVDLATRQPCTLWRSIIRRLPEMVPLLNLVDALYILRPKRQRLADLMAGTIVVRRPLAESVDAPERP